jgi:HD superfamily phosphohydrolase
MRQKVIRDPVHDVIAFQIDRPLEAMLFRLVNAAEFQRLRRIRQLGVASLAYPGADHSRYSHCLGVMEIARQMLAHLRDVIEIDEGQATACVAAALLHDLGHGPLSHVFERISGFHHEEQTRRIILDPASEVNRILREHDAKLPEMVAKLLGEKSTRGGARNFFCDILASQLDADRFDYLLRDNLMTGSRYGEFDLRWLLHCLTIAGGGLAVTVKGVSAVEAYLQARYHMYRNVYFHKVVRTGEGMLTLALRRAKQLVEQGRMAAPIGHEKSFKALAGGRLTLEDFTDLDDIALTNWLKVWTGCQDPLLSRICHGILYRKLYKTVDLTFIADPARIDAIRRAADEKITAVGGDAEYDLFYDEPRDTPYEIYDGRGPGSDITIQIPGGATASIAEISPLTSGLSRQLMFRRLHVAAEFRAVVETAVKSEAK